MMYWGDHMSTGGWIFSILGTLIILALIVGLIGWAVATASDRGGRGAPPSRASARDILDRRLASGELTAEQYEQLRETLGNSPSATRDPQPPRPANAHG
jgi:putative membrane protein